MSNQRTGLVLLIVVLVSFISLVSVDNSKDSLQTQSLPQSVQSEDTIIRGNGTAVVTSIIQAAPICGNGVCQDDENSINCPQDCEFNLDELFCTITNPEGCKSKIFNFLVWIIIISIIFVQIKKRKK